MARDEDDQPQQEAESELEPEQAPAPPRARRWRLVLAILGGVLVLAGLYGWFTREQIADRLIAGQLESLGLPGTYEIESIGPSEQILRNVVIGDPEKPDLTIERVEAGLATGRIKLVKPRLYGSYRDGKLSFGSLDPVIFAKSEGPFRLPDFDLEIVDGRGLLETDYGPVGMKAEGKGALRDGFSGILAVVAPAIEAGGCKASGASLFARISITKEKPHVAGPLRLEQLACPDQGLKLTKAGIELDATADQPLDGGEGQLKLGTGALTLNGNRVTSIQGTSKFTYRKQALTARYELTGKGLATPQIAADDLGLEGVVRTAGGFSRIEVEGDVTGDEFRLASNLDKAMAGAADAGEGTLVAPAVRQIRSALRKEGQGSALSANFIFRQSGDGTSLVVPRVVLRGGSGKALLSFSRLQVASQEGAQPQITGNFSTGGEGLPRLSGRMERSDAGRFALYARMPEYRAGDTRLELPALSLVQSDSGTYDFSGEARLSGALPGGEAERLTVPLQGDWSSAGGLTLWRDCVDIGFDKLAITSLKIDRRTVSLCPPKGRAIVQSGAKGLSIAARAPSLDLSGKLGETPILIASGPLGFAYPGKLSASSVDVVLGLADDASHFRIADLDASLGSEVSGTFSGAEVYLSAVPLDLSEAGGNWKFADGKLMISEGALKVSDREVDARFQPLVAQGATLDLADNVITAEAILREPESQREVVRTEIRHDLDSGNGSADLFVDGILFDGELQPDTLTRMALGVIANAEGLVSGQGRIDWNEAGVTSTGVFKTDSLDFAAAFGPVKGLSGQVRFTDLLGLVTAPDQKFRIASINPGIEVNDGQLSFELRPGNVLAVNGASWPFLGGELELLPTQMTMGAKQDYNYTLKIDALDAAKLIEKLDMANISADGTFDGVLPLVFDKDGGRIVGGVLQSRPPGGNLSYVGKLTYEDLSAIANFAFDALKSLDYSEMKIEMDGSLEGEMITRVSFEGIRQGEKASKNFLTRQVAKLPIRFNVNLKAPFFQLVTSMQSMYDPAYIRDPRTLGLIDETGQAVAKPEGTETAGEADIQAPASEDMQ